MPRVGLTADAIADAAVDVVDAYGIGGLTLAAVANLTGVATPSLYKHLRGMADLRNRLAVRVVDDMTGRLRAAALGRSRETALRAGMRAYRDYVVAHPNRYAALPQGIPDDPALIASGERLLGAVLALLRGYHLTGAAAIHAARCFRAAAHGFASLQAAGAFGLPHDLDNSYDQLINAVALSLGQAA